MHTILFLVSKSEETTRNAQQLAETLTKKDYCVHYASGSIASHIFALCFHRYDAVHIHGIGASSCILFKKILAIRTPFICTLYEREESDRNYSVLYRILIHIRRRAVVHYADELTTSTKHFQQRIYQRYSRVPEYIPNGISDYPKNTNHRKRKYKRDLALITEHEDSRAILRLSRIGLKRGSRLRNISVLTPYATKQEIQTTLNTVSAAFIISPVHSQTLLTQIASFAVPIIAIDTQPHREHLGAEVMYLQDGSTKELRTALLKLRTNNATLRNTAMNRTRRMLSLYSWDHIAEEYSQIYNRPYSISVPLDSFIKNVPERA